MEIAEEHARGLLLGADATRRSVIGSFGLGYKESETEADTLNVLAKDTDDVWSNLWDRRDCRP
jgi:hypothetical protein